MKFAVNTRGDSRVAVLDKSYIISNAQDALDVMFTASHNYGCNKMILFKDSLPEQFFDLKTGLAGEILQKCTNYHFRVAIVGSFERYSSHSLRDFIYESNKGKQVYFLSETLDALNKLHWK